MGARKTIVVVGGAHGGPYAATFAREANEQARIILVEKSPFLAWAQPDLQSSLVSDENRLNELSKAKEGDLKNRYNIEVRLETKALSLDLDSRVLTVDYKNKRERIAFDSLVFAGGAISKELDVPGLTGARVTNYRNLSHVAAIRRAKREGAQKAIVVGLGLYGLEAIVGLKAAGFDVTALEIGRRICSRFSLGFSEKIYEKVVGLGVGIKLDTTIVQAHQKSDKGFLLDLSDKNSIDADLVVVCAGLKPQHAFLANAGAALDHDGSIRVDERMATSLPNVYACGSAIGIPHAVTKERQWIPQGNIILRSAQVAGHNAAIDVDGDKPDQIASFCGTLITDVAGMRFARTGLLEHEAKRFFGDVNIMSTTVFDSSNPLFSPEEMCLRLVVDKKQNRIIGGEVYGAWGVERQIDLIAACVAKGWSPQDLLDLDVSYCSDSDQRFDILKEASLRVKSDMLEESSMLSGEKLALWLAKEQDFSLVNVSDAPLLTGQIAKRTKNIPLEHLRDRLDEISHDGRPIVLCSKSGYRSYLALRVLKQRGMTNVYHLDGGFSTLQLVTSQA